MNIKKRVCSIQVIPVDASDPDNVEPQFSGPNEKTTGWGVYRRDGEGRAIWIADRDTEAKAMAIGEWFAKQHRVKIEPQPWKNTAAS